MKKQDVLRLGKETYGTLKIEEAFKKALEPYFSQLDINIKVEQKKAADGHPTAISIIS